MHACLGGRTGLEGSVLFGVGLCLDWTNTKVIRSFGEGKKKNTPPPPPPPPPTLHPLFLHTFLQTLPFQRFINSIKPVLGSLVVMGRTV